MKKLFLVILLTILVLTCKMVKTSTELPAAPEYMPLTSSTEGMVSNLGLAKEGISLELRDIDVKDALKFLATKAGMNIVPTNQVSGRVTLMIKDAPVEDVFEILIRSNKLAYEKVGTIYSVMTEAEYIARYGHNFDDVRQVKIFHLNYAIPDQAFNVIDAMKSEIGKVLVNVDSGTIMVLDTPEKIKEASQTIEALERKSSIKVFNLSYARAKDIETQLKAQLDIKRLGQVRADKRTNQVIVQTLPERMPDVEKIIASLDHKTKEVLIDARIIQIKLKDDLSAGVEWEGLFDLNSKPGELSYLGSYPFSSIGKANDDWRSRVDTFNDVGHAGSYPFSKTVHDANYSAGQKTVGPGQMHIGVVGKQDYDVLIKYLKTLGKVRILSNPKLAVTNNQEARIHVGERQAYITTTTTAGQMTTTVAEKVTYMDIGLQLFITPTINDEGYVTLKIKPELSSVVGTLITAQNNPIPIVDTSTAETTVMVKDGSTIAIGGLSKEEKTHTSSRVPFLSQIPFMGVLFKSDTKGSSRTELLIMVTAHLISGDELTTGYDPDLGYSEDTKYKDYNSMTDESDLSVHEQTHKAKEKGYQVYPEHKAKQEYEPKVKPLKDE